MRIEAPAKINMCLAVVGRRDGYHLLDTIMQEIDLCDVLDIERAGSTSVTVSGGPPLPPDNTVARAAALFHAATGIAGGAAVRIHKRIPVQAGLGGGSSDGTSVLKALNTLHGEPLGEGDLARLALQIGADCPFFVRGGIQRAQGIGEVLTPLQGLEKMPVLLVKPPCGVDTAAAFAAADQLPPVSVDVQVCADALGQGDLSTYFAHAGNALQPAAARMVPEIARLGAKCRRLGATFWQMSGSGSCIFAVFPDMHRRRQAHDLLARDGRLFVAEAETRCRS